MWADGFSKNVLHWLIALWTKLIFFRNCCVVMVAIPSPHQKGAAALWTVPTLQHQGQRHRRKNLKAFRISAVLDHVYNRLCHQKGNISSSCFWESSEAATSLKTSWSYINLLSLDNYKPVTHLHIIAHLSTHALKSGFHITMFTLYNF